jgi:hypothetical protein
LAAQVLHHHLEHTHIVVYREDNWLAHASLVYCLGITFVASAPLSLHPNPVTTAT